jgi:hypothetical protein
MAEFVDQDQESEHDRHIENGMKDGQELRHNSLD